MIYLRLKNICNLHFKFILTTLITLLTSEKKFIYIYIYKYMHSWSKLYQLVGCVFN